MRTLVLITILLLCGTGCRPQENKRNGADSAAAETAQNQPQVSWKVNKETDENGNLIRYDSTYVWSYSNKGAAGQVKVDSVLNEFRKGFDLRFNNVFNRSFGQPVWNDSLFHKNFLKPDYYTQKWMDEGFDIRYFMQQMDSSRNAFLKEHYPGLEAPGVKKPGTSKQ